MNSDLPNGDYTPAIVRVLKANDFRDRLDISIGNEVLIFDSRLHYPCNINSTGYPLSLSLIIEFAKVEGETEAKWLVRNKKGELQQYRKSTNVQMSCRDDQRMAIYYITEEGRKLVQWRENMIYLRGMLKEVNGMFDKVDSQSAHYIADTIKNCLPINRFK